MRAAFEDPEDIQAIAFLIWVTVELSFEGGWPDRTTIRTKPIDREYKTDPTVVAVVTVSEEQSYRVFRRI